MQQIFRLSFSLQLNVREILDHVGTVCCTSQCWIPVQNLGEGEFFCTYWFPARIMKKYIFVARRMLDSSLNFTRYQLLLQGTVLVIISTPLGLDHLLTTFCPHL